MAELVAVAVDADIVRGLLDGDAMEGAAEEDQAAVGVLAAASYGGAGSAMLVADKPAIRHIAAYLEGLPRMATEVVEDRFGFSSESAEKAATSLHRQIG
ncbi:hypothetical protein [Streptomyces flavofungini]|uniref:hypothetical protein n=1 Tax=Streptomyces flavofungini TaxID=68200 RepID=UPI0025AF323D|nr:hypothetical protein [Streptomyces flavofungini]WJV49901.1 hypothetical protein QUY26_32890 [Streptomyces flavofungini]